MQCNQLFQYGQAVSTDNDDTGSFLCAHDPYFTLIPESEVVTEMLTVTDNEFEEALNDTIAENDGFVAPNYDYVTTLAPMKTVENVDGDNFINARIRPFHDTDQVQNATKIYEPEKSSRSDRLSQGGPSRPTTRWITVVNFAKIFI